MKIVSHLILFHQFRECDKINQFRECDKINQFRECDRIDQFRKCDEFYQFLESGLNQIWEVGVVTQQF